jgi:hypothetical protein
VPKAGVSTNGLPLRVTWWSVVILSKDGQVAWPVDAVCFQFDRATGLVQFHNVANDKLNLTHSVVGRLFVALRDAQG